MSDTVGNLYRVQLDDLDNTASGSRISGSIKKAIAHAFVAETEVWCYLSLDAAALQLQRLIGTIQPAYTLAILPHTMLGLLPSTGCEDACTMLPAFTPLTIIIASVLQCEPARAALLVVCILAVISAAVWPCAAAGAMLAVRLPLANKPPAVTPGVHTLTVNIIRPKFTLVGRLVGPYKVACPVFHAVMVLAHVNCTTWPLLRTLAMLLVVLPLAFEASPRSLHVDAMTMSSVVLPPAFVHVTVGLLEAPVPLGHVFHKLAFILCAIWPHLDTMSIPDFAQPLTYIADSIPKTVLWSVLAHAVLCATPARSRCSKGLDDHDGCIATKTFALTYPFAVCAAIPHDCWQLAAITRVRHCTAPRPPKTAKLLRGPNMA